MSFDLSRIDPSHVVNVAALYGVRILVALVQPQLLRRAGGGLRLHPAGGRNPGDQPGSRAGAASLAVGLALQGTLSNMAAGVMLLVFRPLRIGDSIEVAGKNGTVKNLNLLMTELASGDNVQVLIPNSQVWGAAMTNFSAYPTRRVSAAFVVPADRDPQAVARRLRESLQHDTRVLRSPPPSVAVSNLTDKGVEISMEAWANVPEAGGVREHFIHESVAALQAH